MKKYITIGLVAVLLLSMAVAFASAKGEFGAKKNPHKDTPIIYVSSQDKCYQSIVGPTLPYNEGNAHTFQLLDGHTTMYGPGDKEYNGGKWWVDRNGNGEMDPEGTDHYFSCPLLFVVPCP